MTPRLVSFYEGKDYARMARVLDYSAHRHCADWQIEVQGVRLYSPTQISVEDRCRQDTSKLLRWVRTVEEAPEGAQILLIDCDILICRSLDAVWGLDFDVAYTARDRARTKLPLNAGVIFARATPAARRFLRAWYDRTLPIKASPAKVRDARKRFGACEQAGLAGTLASSAIQGVQIVALPCREWNSEDSEWGRFDLSVTRIVHIKGALRQMILGQPFNRNRTAEITPLAKLWRRYEQAAKMPEAVSA